MDISNIVLQDLKKLLPSSILEEVVCFCFYDEHPRDIKKIDIVVCTKRGEVMEFHNREMISSVLLENTNIIDITSLRNEGCELFYFIHSKTQIIILSVKEKMSIHLKINNVERYDFVDNEFSGLPCLKVLSSEDAVPLLYDSNFKLLAPMESRKQQTEDFPVITHLSRKLTEAKYSVKQNESILNEYIKLKQTAAFCFYERNCPNADDSVFKLGTSTICKALSIKTEAPFVKVCNKKIVVIVKIKNEDCVNIDNMRILFHGIDSKSISYTTKVLKEMSTSPFWKEKSNTIISNEECFIVAVIEMRELKYIASSRIEFEAVLSYSKVGSRCVLPLENVSISALDTMGENFDLLTSDEDSKFKILGIIATSEETEVILRHIDPTKPNIDIPHIICKYLSMEFLSTKVLIHKKSPSHILHGLTLIFLDDPEIHVKVQVYSRSPTQVLAFILYMYDTIPYRIMATLPNHNITAKTSDLAQFNSNIENSLLDFKNYASSLINISKQILEYFDKCMIKMNESSEPEIKNKIGNQINLLSMGLPEYLKFRNKLLQEFENGIQSIKITNIIDACSEVMEIDD